MATATCTRCDGSGCDLCGGSGLKGGDEGVAFARTELRHRRLKVRGTCGHLIDGSRLKLTPYRYTVWKVKGEHGVRQLIECENCARRL